MFKKIKNIDTAFRYIRLFTLVIVTTSILITGIAVYYALQMAIRNKENIYVIADGKILQAFSSTRRENIPVEARDHVSTFHHYFFTLDPDDGAIQQHMNKALYLADETAKRKYDDLRENGYYSNLISGNVNQTIEVDSVSVDVNQYPYYFKCYASQFIVRPLSITHRKLVTEGYLRQVSRSDHNAHGFLIERWKILVNEDLDTKNRRR